MTTPETLPVTRLPQRPFGLVLQANTVGADLRAISPETLGQLTVESKVLVLRGFHLLEKDALVEYCENWGELLTWDFGAVFDLIIHEDPKNYLFSRGDVPYHWDGAFTAATPRFFLFQCLRAPATGGETIFCDTTEVIRQASEETRALWQSLEITYNTDKLAHYGGQVTAPLMATHPATGEPILRFAEPLDPARYLNPLFVSVSGIPEQDTGPLIADLYERLRRPDVCYQHRWLDGDIVVVDNFGLLHGRNAFNGDSSRHLQRIQII